MPWAGARGRTLGGRCSAYPMVLLLAVVFAAGCGGPPPPTGPAARGSPAATAKAPPPVATPPATSRYVFPVQGKSTYHPTHAGYPGTDIFADCGSPVVAVTDGEILEVSRVDKFNKDGTRGPFNGGKFVSLLGDDGVRYYGSHLTDLVAGIEAGVRVRADQQVGTVGTTGNANNVCHLHFGISPPCQRTGDWWIRRGVIWPAPYLDDWRNQAGKSPADQVHAWHRDRGCPGAP